MSSATFQVPRVVPSDVERDRVADTLRSAVGTGLLSLEQFEERLDAAYAATTLTELQGLIPWVNPPHRPARNRRYWWLAAVPLLFTSFAFVRLGITSVDRHERALCQCLLPKGEPTPSTPPNTAAPAAAAAPAVPIQPECVAAVPFDQRQQELLNVSYELLPPTDVIDCTRQAHLQLQHLNPSGPVIHVHLDLIIGNDVRVPAGLGIDPRSGDTSGIFTTSDNGIITADATTAHTLGQVFIEWGHPLRNNAIGTLEARDGRTFNWFVNGVPVADPANVVLHDHNEIEMFEDAQGASINPKRSFNWPRDLGPSPTTAASGPISTDSDSVPTL